MSLPNAVVTRRGFLKHALVVGGSVSLIDLGLAGTLQRSESAEPGTLRMSLSFSPESADPIHQQTSTDYYIYANVLDRLVELDPANMKPRASLALSWRTKDPTTYVFRLRRGVRFHDGSPFDASAAKKNLERMMTGPSTQTFTSRYKSVEAPNPDTLVLRLKEPYAYAVHELGFFQMSLVSPASFDKGQEWLSTHAVGTGPFKLSQWVPGERFVLEPNAAYWGGSAKVNRVVFQVVPDASARLAALEAGDLDIAADLPVPSVKQLQSNGSLQLLKFPVARTYFLMYQLQDPVLANADVRKAIAMAIDRKALAALVSQDLNRLADNLVPPEAIDGRAVDPGISIEYNPEKAKALLKQSGADLAGKTLEMIPDLGWVAASETAQAIQEYLRKIGLTVKISTFSNAEMNALLKGHKYQLSPQGWLCAAPDSALRRIFSDRSPWAYPNLHDPAFEAMIDRAAAILDDAQRQAAYKAIFAGMLTKAIYTPIYWKLAIVGASRKVQGLQWSPLDVPLLHTAWVGG